MYFFCVQTTLLTIGIVCVVAAIVGGGMKLLGNEIPVLANKWRQVLLAIFGIALIIASQNINKLTGTQSAQNGETSGTPSSTDSGSKKTGTDSVKPQPVDTTPVKPPPVQPPVISNILLNYSNSPEYIAPGSEALIRITAASQTNTILPNVLVVLTSPAGTVFKQLNINIVSGYTDAEGNFLAYFVYPSIKPLSYYPLTIDASWDNIKVSGNIKLYSTMWATLAHIPIRNIRVQPKMQLRAIQTRVVPHQ